MRASVLFLLIAILACLLRFWQLGINPPSLDWDEVSLGYNAYSILKTGRDEYGTLFPLAIRSFGDFKPPLYTYLTIAPVALFGLNEYSVRFISALFGFLTVFMTYLLVKELIPRERIALLSAFLLAISPWHLQFSRTAFESNLSLFFLISGVYAFLWGLKKESLFILSGVLWGISLYAYHSPRLIAPVLIAGLSLIFFRKIWQRKWWFTIGMFIFGLMFLPIIIQMRSTGARFGSVSAVNPDEKLGASIAAIEYDLHRGDWLGKFAHNRRIIFGREILGGYLDHFNFDFLFLTGDAPGRHHASGMGMLYVIELPLIVIGMFSLFRNFNREVLVIFLWFILAPIASSLTSGTPHAVRALIYLPTYQIFTAIGLFRMTELIIKAVRKLWIPAFAGMTGKNMRVLMTVVISLMLMINVFYYLRMYYVHTPVEYSQWWQYGYKQVVEVVSKIEDRFERVIVTYKYDQPYIYFLFYNKVDPLWYQAQWGGGEIMRSNRSFGNYEFRYLNWEEDSNLTNTIFVGSPDEVPPDASGLVKEIKFLDGTVAFRIVARK